MGSRIASILLRRRWLILGLLLLATAAAVALATQVKFDFTPQVVFAAGDDAVEFSERFKKTFGYEDAVLAIVMEATDVDAVNGAAGKSHDILSRDLLDWQVRRALDFDKLDHVTEVLALPIIKLPVISITSPGGLVLKRQVRRLPVTDENERQLREIVAESDLLQGTFVSRDKRFGTLVVTIDPEARQIDTLRSVVTNIETILAENPPPTGYRIRLAGLAALRLDIVNNLQADLLRSVPLAAGVLCVAILIMFRRTAGLVLSLTTVGMAVAWMMGLIVVAGEHLNIISNVLPLLMIIIGAANCIHVLCRYAEEFERHHGDRAAATRATIAHMAPACMLTYATTAIGFASLAAAQSDVLSSFGWQAAAGMGLLYVATLGVHATLMPLFRAPAVSVRRSPIAPVVAAAGYFVARHPRLVVAGSLAIIATSLWLGRNMTVDSYHVETYEADHPMMETLHVVDEHLGGVLPLEISIAGNEPGRLLDPAVYAKVAAITKFAAEQPEVLFARSYVDLHQELYARRKHDPQLREDLPADNEAGQRRLQKSHELLEKFAGSLHYQAFLTEDASEARILLRLKEVGTKRTGELIDLLEAKLAELFPEQSGVVCRVTGDSYLNARRMDRFVRDLFTSLLMAAVTMFGIIALLFRSLRIGLIAGIPNLTPLFVTLGYMQLRGYDMNTSNVIVFAISLGIAVDDTIHFLARFRAEVLVDGDVAAAIRRTLQGAGRAIVVTSVLILIGLAVLSTSSFVPTQRFAELTAVTIAAALVGDLLLLPGCLALWWKPGCGSEGLHPQTQPEA